MRWKVRTHTAVCFRRFDPGLTFLIVLVVMTVVGVLHFQHDRTVVTNVLGREVFPGTVTQASIRQSENHPQRKAKNIRNDTTEQTTTKPREKYEWCSSPSSVFPQNSTFVEDLFNYNISFIKEGYKNPCFYDVCKSIGEVPVSILRCLPYFQLIGVDKCGSTDLFERITQHPQILDNDGVLNKEASWWSWRRYGYSLKKTLQRRESFDQYLKYFDRSSAIIENIVKADNYSRKQAYHPLITGDGTPMDFWDFTGWTQIRQNKRKDSPIILTPHLIKHVNPDVKLILILRDPTERLYSDYVFLKRGRISPAGFHTAVMKSLTYFWNCTKLKSTRLCLFDKHLHNNTQTRIHVSIYSVYLREWLRVFPRNQLLILRSEDYSKDIALYLHRIFNFLGVGRLSSIDMKKISSKSRAYQTKKKAKIGPMLPETRKILDNFFRPYNEELVELIKDDIYLWNDVKVEQEEKDKKKLLMMETRHTTEKF